MAALKYIEKVPEAERSSFEAKVRVVAGNLNVNPDWLMCIMQHESDLNPQAVCKFKGDNPDPSIRCKTRATGLIQFMPATSKNLGTTNEALYKMSRNDQMDFVYSYYKCFKGKYKTFTDLYCVNFWPAAVGKPDEFVFETKSMSAETVAKQNPLFDLNKDFKITMAEFKQYVKQRFGIC